MDYEVERDGDRVVVFAYNIFTDYGVILSPEEAIAFAHEIIKLAEELKEK